MRKNWTRARSQAGRMKQRETSQREVVARAWGTAKLPTSLRSSQGKSPASIGWNA